ncbi:DMT family transporter [Polaromonas sp.]|uniref:DMT family transporter n=1 Tax=Polaromonas sp. TaxID=1869339 RepID=UPI003752276A
MSRLRLLVCVCLAMAAFAGNSLLCRMALKHTAIDAASFTAVRLVSGACMLWLLVRLQRGTPAAQGKGDWLSASALFAYAAGFSFAYISMSAATSALLLFGSVQATMIFHGISQGERLRGRQLLGLAVALAGLVALLLPGLATPSLSGALCMLGAGVAWGVYSLRGKRQPSTNTGHPTAVTAGNFMRTVPMALVLALVMVDQLSLDSSGLVLAMLSGALASGIGYAIWYYALPALKATHAATVQLSVPVIAALGGALFLGEAFTLPLLLSSCAILGGIALLILDRPAERQHTPAPPPGP